MDEITVNLEIQFVGEAWAKLKDIDRSGWSPAKAPPAGIYPQVGDWFSFPGQPRYTFKVVGREIQYRTENEVYLKLVLDIHCEHEDDKAPLRLVRSEEP